MFSSKRRLQTRHRKHSSCDRLPRWTPQESSLASDESSPNLRRFARLSWEVRGWFILACGRLRYVRGSRGGNPSWRRQRVPPWTVLGFIRRGEPSVSFWDRICSNTRTSSPYTWKRWWISPSRLRSVQAYFVRSGWPKTVWVLSGYTWRKFLRSRRATARFCLPRRTGEPLMKTPPCIACCWRRVSGRLSGSSTLDPRSSLRCRQLPPQNSTPANSMTFSFVFYLFQLVKYQ